MSRPNTIDFLFREKPAQWGLRGDPHLWKEMGQHFADTFLPASTQDLAALVEEAFVMLTGHSISEPDPFFVGRFSHGGMSSGQVSPKYWREQAIPLLKERFDKLS